MIKTYTFDTKISGPKLLIFGAIHGNEICGTYAIKNIIQKIQKGKIKLLRGSVTFIPKCNEAAYEQNKRYIEKNLNRVFRYNKNPLSYEEKLANELLPYVKKADYLLDLHSMPTNGTPFAFLDYLDKPVEKFVTAQGLEYALVGWPQLFSENGELKESATSDYAQSVGTIAVTVECGSHDDPKAVSVAKRSIMNSLLYLNIVENNNNQTKKTSPKLINMTTIVRKNKKGHLSRNWQHLDKIKKGELLAEYDNGEKIVAKKDGYIILPHENPTLGDEWFYLGESNMGKS